MSPWTDDELRRIAQSDDLHIAPFGEDGLTYGTLTWIWSVRREPLSRPHAGPRSPSGHG